jgi:hypothetical protein
LKGPEDLLKLPVCPCTSKDGMGITPGSGRDMWAKVEVGVDGAAMVPQCVLVPTDVSGPDLESNDLTQSFNDVVPPLTGVERLIRNMKLSFDQY